jgi:hypothetical protein
MKIMKLLWSQIKQIIDDNQLELLKRSDDDQTRYKDYISHLLQRWDTIKDYLLVTKFGFKERTNENGKLQAAFVKNEIIIKLHLNDFPYDFEIGLTKKLYFRHQYLLNYWYKLRTEIMRILYY